MKNTIQIETNQQKPKQKYKYDRQRLANKTKQERSLSYDRRSKTYKKRKADISNSIEQHCLFSYRKTVSNVSRTINRYLNNNIYINNYNYSQVNKLTTKKIDSSVKQIFGCKRSEFLHKLSKVKKRKWYMQDNPISPAIRAVKNIYLTRWGQIKASMYCDSAIKHADFHLAKLHQQDRTFDVFENLCREHHNVNKIPCNPIKFTKLANQYNMKANATLWLPNPEKVVKNFTKNESDNEYSSNISSDKIKNFSSQSENPRPYYKSWQPYKERAIEDPILVAEKFCSYYDTPDFKSFVKLMGEEEAKKIFAKRLQFHIEEKEQKGLA